MEVEEFLAHHGVKGMHWGVHRSVSSTEIRAARERHQARVDQLNHHAIALSEAKNLRTKQQHLDEIHRIAREARTSGDIDRATRMTGKNILASGGIGTAVLPGVGTAAGLIVGHHLQTKAAKAHRDLIHSYENSTLKDYH